MGIFKLRAWDSNKKHFYYFCNGRYFDSHNLRHCISERVCSELHWSNSEQYTGLKDKYGKEIYKGDLLEEEQGYLFEVVWDEKSAKFRLQWLTKAIQYPEWNRGVKMQIIGNIHENPKLIKDD